MRDIVGLEGLYAITSCGKVWSYRSKKFLKPYKVGEYLGVKLTKNNERKKYYIHRLVAEAYIPNPNGCKIINHKDENKHNNCINNLEWCTSKYNNEYSGNILAATKSHYRKVRCVETGEIFESIKSAKDKYNINNISAACRGVQKTAGGYHWEYI